MDYLSNIYEKMGEELDPSHDYFETDSRFLSLEQILRELPAGQMCDLGCGRGALLKRLSDKHVGCGTDYDPGAVKHCIANGLNVRQIDLNQASDIPFPGLAFDVIVISEVCEHLLDPRNAIRIAVRRLKPGGTLVVTVPNAVPLFVRLKLLFGKTVPWLHYPSPDTERTGHIRFYTTESMRRLLSEEGLSVSTIAGVSFRMNGWFWQRLCFWLPRLCFSRSRSAPTRMDQWLARRFPGLSPGLLFVCKRIQPQ